jgi:hypothetical protein
MAAWQVVSVVDDTRPRRPTPRTAGRCARDMHSRPSGPPNASPALAPSVYDAGVRRERKREPGNADDWSGGRSRARSARALDRRPLRVCRLTGAGRLLRLPGTQSESPRDGGLGVRGWIAYGTTLPRGTSVSRGPCSPRDRCRTNGGADPAGLKRTGLRRAGERPASVGRRAAHGTPAWPPPRSVFCYGKRRLHPLFASWPTSSVVRTRIWQPLLVFRMITMDPAQWYPVLSSVATTGSVVVFTPP